MIHYSKGSVSVLNKTCSMPSFNLNHKDSVAPGTTTKINLNCVGIPAP